MMIFGDDSLAASIRPDKAKRNIQEAKQYFRNDVSSIAKIISAYYPLEILKMAAWEERRIHLSAKNELSVFEASFLPLILQSVVQSSEFFTDRGFSANRDVKKKDWDRLKSLSKDAAKRLLWFIENTAVDAVHEGRIKGEHYAQYRDTILGQFFFPCLDDEKLQSNEAYSQVIFSGDEDRLKELTGSDASFVVGELKKICDNGRTGISRLSEDSRLIHEEIDAKIKALREKEPERSEKELMGRVIREGGYSYRLDDLKHKRDDMDLFEVERVSLLSTSVLKLFSASISSYHGDFLEEGYLPATVKPFLRFADRFYCFTGRTLFSSLPVAFIKEGIISQDKLQKFFTAYVLRLFNETDSVDVYQWRGNRFDISLLPSLSWCDVLDRPEVFESKMQSIEEELARKPQKGHTRLVVFPDGAEKLHKRGDASFSISLAEIIRTAGDEKLTKEFYRTLLGPFSLEAGDMEEFADVIDDDFVNEEQPQEEIEPLSVEVEYEYDSEDDD